MTIQGRVRSRPLRLTDRAVDVPVRQQTRALPVTKILPRVVQTEFFDEGERVIGSFPRIEKHEVKLIADESRFQFCSRVEIGRIDAARGKNMRAGPKRLRRGSDDQNIGRQSRGGIRRAV